MESERRAELGEEEVRQLALKLFGVMRDAEAEGRKTFGELAKAWLSRLRRVGGTENERRHLDHLAGIHALREGQLTAAAITAEQLRLEAAGVLGAASLNKLRSTGKLVIDDAQANGLWKTFNPFDHVKRRRVPKKPYTRLTLAELELAFTKLRPDRRRMARVSLFTGVRPGELLGLKKCDVDLAQGWLNIHRSHERDETKTGMPRLAPIPAAVVEDLKVAMQLSHTELVFPRDDGTRQRRDTKLARILRHGLRLAGVCTSWRYACRKRGCGFKDLVDARQVGRRCPTCGWTLHEVGVPKHFTYYDLRHAASTLHREAGADALAVKVSLGHARRDVNDDVYTHLSDDKLRAEMNRLRPQTPQNT